VQTDINRCKIKNWKERSKNRADLEKSVEEEKVCIGLQCHLRRRRRRRGGGEEEEEEEKEEKKEKATKKTTVVVVVVVVVMMI
jgi:hypothetical protein